MVANSGVGGPNSPDENDRFLRAGSNQFGPEPIRAYDLSNYMVGQAETARHMVVISSCLARFGGARLHRICASTGLLGPGSSDGGGTSSATFSPMPSVPVGQRLTYGKRGFR